MTYENFQKATKLLELIQKKQDLINKIKEALYSIQLNFDSHAYFDIRCNFDFPEAQSHLLTFYLSEVHLDNLKLYFNSEIKILSEEVNELELELASL